MSRSQSIYSDWDPNETYYDGGVYQGNGLGEFPYRSRQHSSSRPSGLGTLLEREFSPPSGHSSRRRSRAGSLGPSNGESYNPTSDRHGSNYRRTEDYRPSTSGLGAFGMPSSSRDRYPEPPRPSSSYRSSPHRDDRYSSDRYESRSGSGYGSSTFSRSGTDSRRARDARRYY